MSTKKTPSTRPASPAPKERYRALVGLNYPPYGKGTDEKRVEPDQGDDSICDDLPPQSIPWLLAQGAVELVVVN